MPSHPSISFLNTGLNLYPSPLIVNIYWGHLLSSPIFFRNFLIVCMMLHSLKSYGSSHIRLYILSLENTHPGLFANKYSVSNSYVVR